MSDIGINDPLSFAFIFFLFGNGAIAGFAVRLAGWIDLEGAI